MCEPTQTALQRSTETVDWPGAVQSSRRHPITSIADHAPYVPVLRSMQSPDGASSPSLLIRMCVCVSCLPLGASVRFMAEMERKNAISRPYPPGVVQSCHDSQVANVDSRKRKIISILYTTANRYYTSTPVRSERSPFQKIWAKWTS